MSNAYERFMDEIKYRMPEIDPTNPWFRYVRNSILASRIEFFGFSFYHFYVSEKKPGGRYSIRYKDVRNARNPWRTINIKARDLDHLHKLAERRFKEIIWSVLSQQNVPCVAAYRSSRLSDTDFKKA